MSCGVCRGSTTNKSSLQCSERKCLKWFHIECENVTKNRYKHFMQEKKKPNGEKWVCSICTMPEPTNRDLLRTLLNVQSKLEDMDIKYQTLINEHQKQLEINKKLENEIVQIKKELKMNQIEKNIIEQQGLRNNAIINGIPVH